METKLKTLKDLRKKNVGIGKYTSVIEDDKEPLDEDEEYVQREEDLKKEVIKWIKKFMRDYKIKELPEIRGFIFKKDLKNTQFTYLVKDFREEQISGLNIIAVLMNFFNISDKELK